MRDCREGGNCVLDCERMRRVFGTVEKAGTVFGTVKSVKDCGEGRTVCGTVKECEVFRTVKRV